MSQGLSQNELYWTTLTVAEQRELAASVVQWIEDLRNSFAQHSKANDPCGSFERISTEGSEVQSTRPESALDRYLNNLRKWQLERVTPERLQVSN
jgi:hypothetical protein